jgi:hypothetical protein
MASKYFTQKSLYNLNLIRKKIFIEREKAFKEYGIDLLDTDALSSLSIYEIVKKYDKKFNINFSRNGEDALSNDVLIECKTSKIDNDYTKTGKLRKNAGIDASFLFHANGDLSHQRYILVARRKENLNIVRLYDVSGAKSCKIIQKHLESERDLWHKKGSNQKRDVICLPEKLLTMLPLKKKLVINGVNVFIS